MNDLSNANSGRIDRRESGSTRLEVRREIMRGRMTERRGSTVIHSLSVRSSMGLLAPLASLTSDRVPR